MKAFLEESVYFGVVISLISYGIGTLLKKKWKLGIFNPLLLSTIITILFLVLMHIDYEEYNEGAQYLSYLLTPATVCLAIPLYENLEILKKNWRAVILGITSGVLSSLCCILSMALLFHLNHQEYVTLLPKSITTAIGMGISEELGGYVPITVAIIIITGVLGNAAADLVFKIFRIQEPVARGIALGTSAHAIGTAKAIELGDVEGALSSLSIAVSGILTVAAASIFAEFI